LLAGRRALLPGVLAFVGSALKAIAIAKVNGHRRVIARGRIRHHKLTLVCRHLRRGRYKLTLLEVGRHGRRTVIGHTSIAVT
jgi:hypothetical protein